MSYEAVEDSHCELMYTQEIIGSRRLNADWVIAYLSGERFREVTFVSRAREVLA